jgi:hypothetical protein
MYTVELCSIIHLIVNDTFTILDLYNDILSVCSLRTGVAMQCTVLP